MSRAPPGAITRAASARARSAWTWCSTIVIVTAPNVPSANGSSSAEAITYCTPADSAGVQYVIASAEELPFADGTFGAVTMTMVLHHVQAERALAEAARVIAPGGALLILGYGRYGGWRDAPHEVRDLLTHRLVSCGMRAWDQVP